MTASTNDEPPRPTVYVARGPNGPLPRWDVRVAYPGKKPVSLVSTTDRAKATKMCRAYAARYAWRMSRDGHNS